MPSRSGFCRFAQAVLFCTLLVIVWGGYVRATGSGAGCGNHWPTCNGEIVPRSPGAKTLVEFTHRLTSGVAFLLVFVQLVWSFRRFPRGHEIRRATTLVFILMIVEALVGAGLVIFEMVAGNTATARAYWMAAHLLNTFALLAAMATVIHRAARADAGSASPSGWTKVPATRPPIMVGRLVDGALAAVVVVAMTGAVVALGDTLFPAESLAHGFAQDFAPTAHLFVRLRVVHPVAAAIAAMYLLAVAALLATRDPSAVRIRRLASTLAVVVALQIAVGIANLLLLAPTSLQLLHLLVADILWLTLVGLRLDLREAARASSVAFVAAGSALAAADRDAALS